MKKEDIHDHLRSYAEQGKRIFVSSSFQTHSIPLLHILSTSGVDLDVLFINTGFHFPETLSFRDEITELLGLNTINVYPQTPKSQQKNADGYFHYVSDPDYCCYLNKTLPLEPYLQQYDIWVNGVRADQSEVRKQMKVEQPAAFDTIRFHPMLDWTPKMIYDYRMEFNLPEHPLDEYGYMSIGCVPCTRKMTGNGRDGRWFGQNKIECGLNTDLVKG